MRRSPLIGSLAALSLVVALAACGEQDEPTADEVQADVSEELQAYDGDLTDEQADCIAEAIIDEVGQDEVTDIDFADDSPTELGEEFGAAAIAARDECLGEPADPELGDPAETTSTTAPQ
jgi:hypothetical protein